jgi:hypothetical protein
MAIDIPALLPAMLTAARDVSAKQWPEMREFAETEFRKLGESLAMIERLVVTGKITEEQARLHLEIQKAAMRTVLLTIEGLGILAVERAINAALDVVRDTVNTALGFALV